MHTAQVVCTSPIPGSRNTRAQSLISSLTHPQWTVPTASHSHPLMVTAMGCDGMQPLQLLPTSRAQKWPLSIFIWIMHPCLWFFSPFDLLLARFPKEWGWCHHDVCAHVVLTVPLQEFLMPLMTFSLIWHYSVSKVLHSYEFPESG